MAHKYNWHFEISERRLLLRIFDVLWVLVALYAVNYWFKFDYVEFGSTSWLWCIVLAVYLNIFTGIFELYDLQVAANVIKVLQKVVLATSVTVLFFLLTPVVTPVLPENRLQILYFFLTILTALIIWRYAYLSLITSPRFYRRVLIVGAPLEVEKFSLHLKKADPNYHIVGFINSNPKLLASEYKVAIEQFESDDLSRVLADNNIDELLISELYKENADTLYEEVFELLKKGYPVKDFYEVYEDKTYKIPVPAIERNFHRLFPSNPHNNNRGYQIYIRVTDIAVSLVGLSIGCLLLPVVYFGNHLANKGSVFYRQERVGINGKTFVIYKFRTMRLDAEAHGAVWATKNDLRITRFGKFLRRSRLDEFPQFYNILKGEMSLIGPRPERPIFVKELSQTIPFYDTRHFVKPGLTGWAQVMTEYADSHADSLEKLQYDLYYIKHKNFFLDLSIMLKTLSTVIFFRGQ